MLKSSSYLSALVVALAVGFGVANPLAATPDPPTPDAAPKWQFIQRGESGVIALELMIVSPTLALFFDRAANDPLQINNHSAWGALWNLETHTATPLDLITNTFCASGAFLSNGTMVSVGGTPIENPDLDPDQDGLMSIRLFGPCADPAGRGCTVLEDPVNLHLNQTRWYTSAIRIFDGSLLVVGGIHVPTPFYNTDPVNSFEFFPKKDGGVPRPSAFLERSLPANLFPRTFALPDGKIFMVANNQSIIYDVEKNTETILPDVPNGVRVTNPFDGSAALLPLSPPLYIPEVLVCGGTNSSDQIPSLNLSAQDPASSQCSRITLTPEGIQKGWEVEQMLGGRMMPELINLPNGQILITNGARTGYAAVGSVGGAINNASNADHPVLTPELYTPTAPLGRRISNAGMPTTNIPRMYHSGTSLAPQGNILLGGSNPNGLITNTTTFHSEFRVETLNPPYMFVPRPSLLKVPSKILFNQRVTIPVSIPPGLKASNIQVSLMDLGFSSHASHSSGRLVFLVHSLSADRRSLTITSPPNNRVFPPGPAFLFLTIDDVTSPGEMLMLGTGASPPVPDQGIPLRV